MVIRLRKRINKNSIFFYFFNRWQTHRLGETEDLPSSNTTIIQTQNDMLTKSVSVEEVITAVKELQLDKAPGPDGFQALFFRDFWPIVHKEVVDAVIFVLNQGTIPDI